MANFFLEIVNMSITASYLIVAVIILRLVLAKAPKWIRGIFWGLVGIRLVVPFSFESMFSLLPGKSPIPADTLQSTATGTDAGASPVMLDFNTSAGAAPQSTDMAGTFVPVEEAVQTASVSWTDILAIVWLVGMIVMLDYDFISHKASVPFLESIAKDYDIPIIVSALVSREVENRDDYHPTRADIKNKHLKERDTVMLVYREGYYDLDNYDGDAELIIDRRGEVNREELFYCSARMKFLLPSEVTCKDTSKK